MKEMEKEPYKMTITGTIRKNKPDIPNEMKIASKEPPSTKFCHHQNITLASFTPKKHRIVLVVSNKITTTNIGRNNKPESILFYNQTKGGTDVFDKLCHAYTVTRGTRRWPMRFFYGMLDQSVVNARILYTCKYPEGPKYLSAVNALKKLVFYLVTPYLQDKLQNVTLRTDIKKGVQMILGINIPQHVVDRPVLQKRARCLLCPYSKDRKTKEQCPSCQRPMCNDHRAYLCNDCAGNE